MNIQSQELIDRLARFPNMFRVSPVIVSNGQFVPIDLQRGVLLDPACLRLMAEEFKRMIDFSHIDVIAGVELQGVSLATSIALATDKPMVIVREKAKRAGRSPVVGDSNFLFSRARVLLVDDLLSYGGTKQTRIQHIEERGAHVTDIAVFFQAMMVRPEQSSTSEYNYGAGDWIQERGMRVHTLITIPELAELQEKAEIIDAELAHIAKHMSDGPHWEQKENLERLHIFIKKSGHNIEDFVLQFMRERGVVIE